MSSNILPNLVWIIPMMLMILFGIVAVREYLIRQELSRIGQTVRGEVLRRWPSGRYSFVAYRFEINLSDLHEGSQQIGPLHYFRLKEGTKVDVIYLPTNPRISRLANQDNDNSPRDSSILICFTMLGILAIVLVR